MSTSPNDQASCEKGQRQQWDSVAAGWKKWWRTIEAGAQCVSQRMIELAEVRPGHRVLDIATGIGEPALLAAIRVGVAGKVIATDFSSQMLAIARERATSMGLTNVEFIEASAEQLNFPDGSFGAVLCRWGITSLPSPMKTLSEVLRVLQPDGMFSTSVWETGQRGRPLAGLAMAVAREMFDLPSPQSEASSLSGSARKALEEEMSRAGFRGVRAEEMTLTLEFPSPHECSQYLVDVSPDLSTLLSDKSSGQQGEYRQRLVEELSRCKSVDSSIRISNVTICAAGRR